MFNVTSRFSNECVQASVNLKMGVKQISTIRIKLKALHGLDRFFVTTIDVFRDLYMHRKHICNIDMHLPATIVKPLSYLHAKLNELHYFVNDTRV